MGNNFVKRVWGLRKWKRLTSVVLRRVGISQLLTIHTGGIKLRFYPAVWNNILWENPDAFRADTDLLFRYLRPGNIVVDLGANVGLLTLVAAKIVGNAGMVYSFEPCPKIYGYLKGNTRHNQALNVKIYNVALGNYDGAAMFSNNAADDGNHIIFDGAGVKVPVNRLDTFLPEAITVHLLKIDVEGFEKFVLEGACRVLASTRCIYFESSSSLYARYGYTCRDVFRMLKGEGFSLYRAAGAGTLQSLPFDHASEEIENLIALKDLAEFLSLTDLTLV